ncbi:MAG TPA: hypothetical protein VJ934_02465 [Desulfomicrobiaceae bacterium]|nr:hypothetical protein [Desulfomicrobiaceae bacterium]
MSESAGQSVHKQPDQVFRVAYFGAGDTAFQVAVAVVMFANEIELKGGEGFLESFLRIMEFRGALPGVACGKDRIVFTIQFDHQGNMRCLSKFLHDFKG